MSFPYPTESEFRAMTPDEFEMFWQTLVGFDFPPPLKGRIFIFGEELSQCYALKRAGWLPILVYPLSSPFQWQWRRPIRPGTNDKKGKRFGSTDAAHRAHIGALPASYYGRSDCALTRPFRIPS